MFVGHYGVSFAAKKAEPDIPLWLLFMVVQLLDVVWAPLVLLGVERVRIVPGVGGSSGLRHRDPGQDASCRTGFGGHSFGRKRGGAKRYRHLARRRRSCALSTG